MLKKKTLSFVLAFGFLQAFVTSMEARALEFGCTLAPAEIPAAGTRLLKKLRAQDKAFPNRVNTRTMFEGHFHSPEEGEPEAQNVFIGTFEGFFRPLDDMAYSYFAIPLLEFQLFRKHDLVYLCAHGDADPKRTHLTLYLLSGYNLDPWTWDKPLEDYFHPDGMDFSTVQVQLIGVRDKIPFFPILEKIPLLGQILQIPDTILDKMNTALGEALTGAAGAHVQRVVLTADYVELDSWFDPQKPDSATQFFRFDFKSAQKPDDDDDKR